MKSNIHYAYFLIIFTLAGVWGVFAFDKPTVSRQAFPTIPGQSLMIYTGDIETSLEQLLEKTTAEGSFRPHDSNSPVDSGLGIANCWIHLPLINESDSPQTWILETDYRWIDVVRLHEMHTDGSYTTYESGEETPVTEKMIPNNTHAFTLHLEPGEQKHYYLFLRDVYWLNTRLSLWRDIDQYIEHTRKEEKFSHVYFGLLAGLFITNFCVFLAFRYNDIRYYLFYLASAGILQCVNFNLHVPYMQNTFIEHSDRLPSGMNFFLFGGLLVLSAGLLLLFSSEFLQIKKIAPRLHSLLKIPINAFIIGSPVIMFGPAILLGTNITPIIAMIWATSHICAFVLGIFALMKKVPQTRYFIPALLLLFIVSWRFNWNLINGQLGTSDVLMQWLYASCLEMIVFTFALVERFVVINKSKDEAQRIALKESENYARLQTGYNTQLSSEVKTRTEALENANAQKDELLRIITHDLKSPVDGVNKLATILARDPQKYSSEQVAAYTAEIEASTSQLSALMKNVLDWGALKEKAISPKPYLVLDLFNRTAQIYQYQLDKKQLRLQIEAPQDLYVACDFNGIATVLRNLLSNAIKYSSTNQQITLSTQVSDDVITLSVEDQGVGMTAERLLQLDKEEPVDSFEGTQEEAGTGIGLKICTDILKLHESNLRITSTEGKGTRCEFALKRWKGPGIK